MTQREEFEKWAAADGHDIVTDEDGDYRTSLTACIWEAWQASRDVALEDAAKLCEMAVEQTDVTEKAEANALISALLRSAKSQSRKLADAIRTHVGKE